MRFARWGPPAAALLTLITLVAAYGFTPGVSRVVGQQDELVFRNFQAPELMGGRKVRWSKGGLRHGERCSTITLPQVGTGTDSVLDLQVSTPETGPAIPVAVSAHDETLLATEVRGSSHVVVRLPRRALAGGAVRVDLVSGRIPSGGARSRGVAVERVTWTPVGWTFPPLRQLWLLPGLAVAVAALSSRLGFRPHVACLAAAVFGSVVAVAAALRPLEVAPFTHHLLIATIVMHGALLLFGGLVRLEGQRWWRLPEQVGAEALAIFMGIAYGAMLAYHVALERAGDAPRPTSASVVAGALVAVGLAAIAASALRWRRQALALGLLAVAAIVAALGAGLYAFHRPAVDFTTLWTGARNFTLGGSLYKVDAILGNHFGPVFKVPPFYGMALLPLARIDAGRALLVVRTIDVVLYLGCGAALSALLRRHLGWPVAVGAVAVIMGFMRPAFDAVAYGQIDIVLLTLLTLALMALCFRQPTLAGLAIGLAVLFKLYPLLLVLFLGAQRAWKAVAWTAIWLLLLIAMAVAVMGWHEHVVYATAVLPHIGSGTGWVENQTLNGFVCRLRGAWLPVPVADRPVEIFTRAAFALVALVSALAARRRAEPGSTTFAVGFSIFLVAMVMAVPAAWIHYETITILPFVALVWSAADAPFTRAEAAGLAAAFGLVAYGNQWSFFDGSARPGLTVLGLSLKLYGLLLLWWIAVRRSWRRVPSPSGSLANA